MFGGLGDVVRELRELVKDLWYRNRLERRILELEVRRLELAFPQDVAQSQLPMPPTPEPD